MSANGQIDLFVPPLLPGLRYGPDLVSAGEEVRLIDRIYRAPLTPFRFQQWTGKRLTCSYGWSYDFEHGGSDRPIPCPTGWFRYATAPRASRVLARTVSPRHCSSATIPAPALAGTRIGRYSSMSWASRWGHKHPCVFVDEQRGDLTDAQSRLPRDPSM